VAEAPPQSDESSPISELTQNATAYNAICWNAFA